MKRMLNAVSRGALALVAGKLRYQPIFYPMHRASLAGLNFCASGDCAQSGEISAAEYVRRRLQLQGIILPVLFDVGANVGAYSTILRSVFGESAEIHAFEPSSAALSKMLVRLGAGVVGHEMALSDFQGEGVLVGEPGSETASLAQEFSSDRGCCSRVSVRTLDSVCADIRINRIHLLKIDTEGNDLKVLLGAR